MHGQGDFNLTGNLGGEVVPFTDERLVQAGCLVARQENVEHRSNQEHEQQLEESEFA